METSGVDPFFANDSIQTGLKGANMKKIAFYLGLFAVVALTFAALNTLAAQSTARADANNVSVKGKVSCSRFGRGDVTPRKGMSVAQTINYCANFPLQGGEYTLVAGGQVYRLTGDKNLLAKMSGETVTVVGKLSPVSAEVATNLLSPTLEATSVTTAKN